MSMLLKGSNGNEFELAFSRDVLPDPQDGFGDSRWTTVTFRAATADDSWQEDSPAINIFEFVNLAEWLEAVGKAGAGDSVNPEGSSLDLLEPELTFSLSGQDARNVTLRIGFHLHQRPEEFDVDAQTDEAEYIDLHLQRADLLSAAQALRADLKSIERGTGKDDLQGDDDSGVMGVPDDELAMIDRIARKPPGAGSGEDNAGQR